MLIRGEICDDCGTKKAYVRKAHRGNVNRTYISKLETAATYAGLEVIAKLAAVLKIEPAELLRMPPKRGRRAG